MAETLTIEIPIEAVDRTEAGVKSATSRLTAFEKSWDRTQRRLSQMESAHSIELEAQDNATSRIDAVADEAHSLDGLNPEVEVGASNTATDVMQDVLDQAAEVDAASGDVDVGANDTASGVLSDVEDRVAAVDAMSGDVDVGANDTASDVIMDAQDALAEFDGETGVAEIAVDDAATPVVRSAQDALSEFSGSSGSAEIAAHDTASSVIDSVTDKASEWGKSIWTGTIAVAGTGLALLGLSGLGISDTVSTFETFESAMSQVEAISGATGTALEDLTAKAKEMGSTTKFTATEAAEAMTYMAMAGWESSDMLDGIEGIMNLAAASGEDLATTSDIVTDALTAFGLSASDSTHFSDVLATAASSANTTVSGMGETFKYAGSMAGALGYSIEDVALATGLMANSGIKGSMAGTALNTIFTRLATNTSGAADELEALGIDFYDTEGNARDLSDVLDELRIATADYNDEQKTALANTVAGTEAQKGLLAILNASEDDYNSLSEAINSADGSAADMAETMLDNLEGSITLMQSAIDGVKTEVGSRLAPYVASVADMITEAAPGAQDALLGIMDTVDTVADSVQNKITTMTNSEEWENADLFGKVNIAWDTIVAEPFSKWANTKGKNLMSKGLSSLFTEAAKILPGGEEAGITSWISALLVGKGVTTAVGGISSVVSALTPLASGIKSVAGAASSATSIGGFVTSLTSMVSPAALVTAGIAAAAAAIVALKTAIDNYNSTQISNSLETHFGNIELTAQQAAEAAEGILNMEYLVNVELALNEIENADALREEAEKALADNDAIEWKSSVGITLTADDQTEYQDNITTFVNDKIEELESRTYAAHLTVQTLIGGTVEGDSLAASIEEWARADELELTELSNDLQEAVENALTDGIISVDEAEAVSALQEKINSITSRWKAAEAQAQLDWINQEYGSLSGTALTSDSFTAIIDALAEQREAAASETQSLATEFYAYLNAAELAGRISSSENANYKALAGESVRNQEAEDLSTSLEFASNTLTGTYGDKIQSNIEEAQENMANQLKILSQDVESGMLGYLATDMAMGADYISSGNGKGLFGVVNDADQAALNELWESLKPDADAMASLIDEYVAAGQEIPTQIMDQFNETMAIGAASGDTDAAWQVYAKSIAESGDEALIDAINQMDANGQLGDEFSAAWKRAIQATTDEPVTLEGLKTEIDGVEIDTDKEAWVASLNEQLGELGEVSEVTADDVTVTVKSGECLWEIGDALGISWEDIAAQNGIESPYTIYPDQELVISIDAFNAEVDPEAAEESVSEAAQTALDEESSTAETTASTNVTVEVESTDVTEAYETVEEETAEAFSETYETGGSTDVTIEETNNSDDVYSEVGDELQSKFNTAYAVTAAAVITMAYSIANPSATIQLSAGSTASTTVSASVNGYASGGVVGLNGAELSWVGEEGTEYIIPTVPGRRARGISLWEQAGQALGVIGSDGQIAAHANGGIVGLTGEETASNAIIPLYQDDAQSLLSASGYDAGDNDAETNEGQATVSVNAAAQGEASGGNTFEINVDMQPVIKIEGDGMDEQKVFEVLQERIRELADDIGDEIAERMAKIFANMPVTQEA